MVQSDKRNGGPGGGDAPENLPLLAEVSGNSLGGSPIELSRSVSPSAPGSPRPDELWYSEAQLRGDRLGPSEVRALYKKD
jgi:hypothetical protein